MPMSAAQFQRFLFAGIRELIYRKYNEIPTRFTQIYNVSGSDKAFEEDAQIAGVGLLVRQPELTETPSDQMMPGFPKRYTHVDYGLKVGASWQLRRDERATGFWRDRARDLGFSARQTKEILTANYIDSGFTTSLGPDNVPLFAPNHPNIRGGTQSNVLTPASSLSVVSVRVALQRFRRFFDDTGVRRIALMPKWLIVPPELEFDALEIIKSSTRPDTANRADNVLQNRLEVFVWEYLTDPNNWYIFADKSQHSLKFFNRVELEIDPWEDKDTRVDWVRVQTAFSFGHSHWMGTLGSNPV